MYFDSYALHINSSKPENVLVVILMNLACVLKVVVRECPIMDDKSANIFWQYPNLDLNEAAVVVVVMVYHE